MYIVGCYIVSNCRLRRVTSINSFIDFHAKTVRIAHVWHVTRHIILHLIKWIHCWWKKNCFYSFHYKLNMWPSSPSPVAQFSLPEGELGRLFIKIVFLIKCETIEKSQHNTNEITSKMPNPYVITNWRHLTSTQPSETSKMRKRTQFSLLSPTFKIIKNLKFQ